MKFIILFATFIFINSISPSSSALCQCECCLKEPDNPDCQPDFAGSITITNCPTDSAVCTQICKEQYQAQCGQTESLADSTCTSDSTSIPVPATTSIVNGPVQCKCSCCLIAPCNVTNQGNVIADKCDQCPRRCAEQYPSECNASTAFQDNVCGPVPYNHTFYTNYNIYLLLLLLFIFSKEFFV